MAVIAWRTTPSCAPRRRRGGDQLARPRLHDRQLLGAEGVAGRAGAPAPQLTDVEIIQVLTIGPADYVAPDMAGHIRVNSLFISHNVRQAVNEGRADFTPIFLSQIRRRCAIRSYSNRRWR